MKMGLKKETYLSRFKSRVFMTPFIFTLSCSIVQGQTPNGEPNLPPPGAAASAVVQAVGGAPIQLRSSNTEEPPAGENTPEAAEQTGEAAASPAAIQTTSERELTAEQQRAYNYSLKNVDGAAFHKDLSIDAGARTWRPALPLKGVTTVENVNRDQIIAYGVYPDRDDITTYNKAQGRATMTIFKDRKPESHTVFSKNGHFTATPGYCELLRVQTNSASFEELKNRAVTCKSFSDRAPFDKSVEEGIRKITQEVISTHRRNATLMQKSVAQPLIDVVEKNERVRQREGSPDAFPGATKAKNWVKDSPRILSLFNLTSAKVAPFPDPIPNLKPRSILTNTGSPEEAADRAILFELGEACGSLWKDGDGAAGTAKFPRARNQGQGTKK